MRAPLVTISKFVGTISLGLLTGLSYTLTTLTYPTLLYLPTAQTASQAHTYLRTHARTTQRVLSALAITTLTYAFVFAPPRSRHPYLLWTSLACALGLAGSKLERGVRYLASSGSGNGRVLEGGNGGVRINGENQVEIDESAVLVSDGNGSSSGKSESGDEMESVNGEMVRRGVERGRAVEAFRTGFWGLGFVMGVVGIWGDGA